MKPEYVQEDLDHLRALHNKVKGNVILDRILSEVIRDYEVRLSKAISDEATRL